MGKEIETPVQLSGEIGNIESTQTFPGLLISTDGREIDLRNFYRGKDAFLVCSGPSLATWDLSLLQKRGLLTCSVNNAAVKIRTQLWVSYDEPGTFCDVIWRDPGIMKFVCAERLDDPIRIRDAAGQLVVSNEKARDMPATIGYKSNQTFCPHSWLHEDSINSGNRGDAADELGNTGVRSVMLVALKLLYYLGLRRVFLVGCDFRMRYGKDNYGFQQDQSRANVRTNNRSYRVLIERFKLLKPHFDQEGFQIFNCTVESDLKVFPFIEYGEAIEMAVENMPRTIITAGMYERGWEAGLSTRD